MTLIKKTNHDLKTLFEKQNGGESKELPNELRVIEFFKYSKNFVLSAEIIEREAPKLVLQYLHLLGQSIELALKGYILSCGERPKPIHDLVKLTAKAEQLDLSLKQIEASSIVLLNHYFDRDLSTQSKFKTRYPTENTEGVGGPIPNIKVIKEFVESLIRQANSKCIP